MGQTTSSPIGVSTHGQAFTQTEYTRQIMDQLLNYMIKQLSIRDLLHMSKESECKKYVLFKANAIYQYFYELRIFPTKDSKGLLTFRKVDDLVNPKGEQEKERQSLCLIVAYFYTRIFQIYGALALTLIDDMNAMTSSGIMQLPSTSDARLLTPGYYPQNPYYSKGGAPYYDDRRDDRNYDRGYRRYDSRDMKDLKNFEWIRSFLTTEYTSGLGFKTRYTGSSDSKGDIYLKIEDVLRDKDDRVIATYDEDRSVYFKQSAVFSIATAGMNKYATLELYTLLSPGEIKIKTNKLKFTNQYGEQSSTDEFELTFYVERQEVNGKTTYIIKNKEPKNIVEFLDGYFSPIIKYIKERIKIHKDSENRTRVTTGRRSEEGITSHLRLEKMIEDLTIRKPLGHCIARALQLLKTDPYSKEPGISQICSATFADNKRAGVVKPGAPLSEDAGLFALANLFYDTIVIGSPNLTIGEKKIDNKSTMDEYIAFMTTLARQYTIEKGPRTTEEYKKGLSSIIDTRDKEFCDKPEDIPLSAKTSTKVQAIVKTMFEAQVAHAAECFKIIAMLFHITYDPTTKKPIAMKLNDNLITKGFPELERINRITRELLVKYYTNCEDKYREGMGHILIEKKATKNMTNAAAKAEANAKARAIANEIAAKEKEKAAKAQAKAAVEAKAIADAAAAEAELQAKIIIQKAAQERYDTLRRQAIVKRAAEQQAKVERQQDRIAKTAAAQKAQQEKEARLKKEADELTVAAEDAKKKAIAAQTIAKAAGDVLTIRRAAMLEAKAASAKPVVSTPGRPL